MRTNLHKFASDMRCHARTGMLLWMMVAGAARGQTMRAVDAGRWEAVVRGFQSEAFVDREAAQKILDTATWRDVETLRALADRATDANVKARLESRVEVLGVERLVHPPPVTLKVKNAGIKELAGALTAATGTEWTAWDRGVAGGPWNLKAEGRPLWEIFTSLEKQSPAHVQNSGGEVMLAPGPMIPGGLGPIDGDWTEAVVGDFLIHVGIGRGLGHVGLNAAGQPGMPAVKLEYGIRGDPRMRLVRCGIPDILSVVDEKGNFLLAAQPRPTPDWISTSGPIPEVNTALGFDGVAGMGTKLTIKGQLVVRTATAVERVEIAELTNQASAPFMAGGRTWKVWAVDPVSMGNGGQGEWVMNVMNDQAGAGGPLTVVPMSVKVLDAAGTVVWDGVVDQQTSARVQVGVVKLPLKAVFLAAKGSKDVIVPFEIKDVPMPPAK